MYIVGRRQELSAVQVHGGLLQAQLDGMDGVHLGCRCGSGAPVDLQPGLARYLPPTLVLLWALEHPIPSDMTGFHSTGRNALTVP